MIRVVVGIVRKEDGRTLLMQRLPGTFREGQWEFPGGKIKSGESPIEALTRELGEELGIEVCDARPRITVEHAYPEQKVCLDVWQVLKFSGEPYNREGHEITWAGPAELRSMQLLEADRPIVASLELPDIYMITPGLEEDDDKAQAIWLDQLERLLDRGVSLMQLRCVGWSADGFRRLAETVARFCDRSQTDLLLNGPPARVLPLSQQVGAAGCHIPARYLGRLSNMEKPDGLLVGASCHSWQELSAAEQARADFCVLGPVMSTTSHPDGTVLGWNGFADRVRAAKMPVYALGGVVQNDLEVAWKHGAQGVAGISGFWPNATDQQR